MTTFILTWNPDGDGWPDDEYDHAVETTATGSSVPGNWSVALRKSGIAVGDRAFLMRQHHERGLVASAYFTSEIYEDAHWEILGRMTTYADLQWDMVLPVPDRLPVEDLKREVPSVSWDRLQGSGVRVDPANARVLALVWETHIRATPYRSPEELPPATYEEGAVTRINVNRYERDRNARAACIAHHGTTCVVCGFNFERFYGALGRDFIHVHHLKEISTLGAGYKIDPIQDLRPLCANCHSMVHRQSPALSPEQLRRLIKKP